jgi:hypothetical protein
VGSTPTATAAFAIADMRLQIAEWKKKTPHSAVFQSAICNPEECPGGETAIMAVF